MTVEVENSQSSFDILYIEKSTGEKFTVSKSNRKKIINPEIDNHISVRSKSGTHLMIEGNPAKFLQGHNIFGSNNLSAIINEVLRIVFSQLNITPTEDEYQKIEDGEIKISRVDIAGSFLANNEIHKLELLNALKHILVDTENFFTSDGGGETLYIGKSSKYSTIKIYNKSKEIKDKRTYQAALNYLTEIEAERLIVEVSKQIRIEATLRTKPLEHKNLDLLKNWTLKTPRFIMNEVINEHLSNLNVEARTHFGSIIDSIKGASLRLSYDAWERGSNLKHILPKRTYANHRKKLLEYEINISIPASTQSTTSLKEIFNPSNFNIWTTKEILKFNLPRFKFIIRKS
ncbi:phage/plasmid replication protein, II/X family [Deefgea salmonis]|uniref:Phage/plasmid replication protein, II/X family n=1 Tax=Deefgea salmonis TaxID=2875502 RepID=A0ABS8BIZ6_9NEIS|nr:phage/plasmid replication protein, II/X family [Deefgea salmonis]MCB5195686.1 phage/plasmid replication protein, II/X family [Deefgea salmonis]